MPIVRLIGNAVLSFMTKLSSGYWGLFDPTNGFVAIHSRMLEQIPLDKLSKDYFFETDLLFRLYIARAAVIEIPMNATYANECSNLQPYKQVLPFFFRHMVNTFKRVFYSYFLRDFSLASIMLVLGLLFMSIGIIMGGAIWLHYAQLNSGAPIGAVMLPSLLIILGFQMLIGFLSADVASTPTEALHSRLENLKACQLKSDDT